MTTLALNLEGGKMEKCEYIQECAFYSGQLADKPTEADFLKEVFCLKKPSSCARFRRAEQAPVSDNLNAVTPLGFSYKDSPPPSPPSA